MVTSIKRTLNDQHNAIRLASIILDVGTKVIHAHVQHYLEKNGKSDINELLNDTSIVNEKMLKSLNDKCYQDIPKSLDLFDITKSFALINNVVIQLEKEKKFIYDVNKYKYCKQLKDIRNEKYAHMQAFEVNDVDFSISIVSIEEIIRQLCDYDETISQDYLENVEDELKKDTSQINDLKSTVIELLAEQKEEFKSIIKTIIDKSDKFEINEIDLASSLPPRPSVSKLYKRANEADLFEKIAQRKLSCIAGMAGVGKSTLAIMYGHHRKEDHQAKVCFYLKFIAKILFETRAD
jgi:hypothetical protein